MSRLLTLLVAGFIGLVGCSGQPDPTPLMDPNSTQMSDSENASGPAQNFNYTQESDKGDNQYF